MNTFTLGLIVIGYLLSLVYLGKVASIIPVRGIDRSNDVRMFLTEIVYFGI